MDLKKLSNQGLKNLLANCQRHKKIEMVPDIITEMMDRGMATRREFAALEWNQDRVRDIMEPFKKVAIAVGNSQRTAYTQAGGLKIGRRKDSPEWRWVDTYSAIKTASVNAVFGCYIKRPGDEPSFYLRVDGNKVQSFSADQLEEALKRWRDIAARANAS